MKQWLLNVAIKSDFHGALKKALSKDIEFTKDFLDALEEECGHVHSKRKKFCYTCLVCFKKFWTPRKQVGKYCSRACKDESQRGARISKLDQLSPQSLRETFIRRLEHYIEKSDGCWRWKGCLSTRGYGKIFFHRKHWSAHRAAWTVYKGSIPKGKIICHTCDNPQCTNPDHLFIGTFKDNTIDAAKKARLSRLGMTVEDIRSIKKELIHTHYEDYKQIAKKYGLTEEYIKRIAKGERWSAIRI